MGPVEDILRAVQPLDRFVTSEEVLRVPVVKLHTVPGFPTAAFPFTTDVPFLDRWGAPLLFGPGSILVAHTSRRTRGARRNSIVRSTAYEQLADGLSWPGLHRLKPRFRLRTDGIEEVTVQSTRRPWRAEAPRNDVDSLFRFLFEYRPVIFQQGEFRLAPSTGSYVAAVLAVAAMLLAVVTYRGLAGRGRVRDRVVLTALRIATLVGDARSACSGPILVVKAAVPQQNFLAVLIDDSRSMQIADWGTQARGAFVKQTFGAKDAPLVKALSERFVLRPFRFLVVGDAPRIDRRADLRRRADAARSARSTARDRSWPGCRWPAWCSSATAPTRPTRR